MTKPFELSGAQFKNTYQQLPECFYSRLTPTPVAKPGLITVNTELAKHLGLDENQLASPEGLAMLAGNTVPMGASPIAQVYAGHQFGSFNPQLGDGRALLLGELVSTNGELFDVQLKGSGPTPYSRGGDGRAALGPVLREAILSEAMWSLGVKTTRALAAVITGEMVYRQKPIPGAVLTRVAASHVRIGTFEFFRAQGDVPALRQLADFVIDRHYPHAKTAPNPYLILLECVLKAQASLIASWLHLGFIHGVMNTDNMTLSGETIDYGPCAFMNNYKPATVFSSIDHAGRYAYNQQGEIGLWNLTRFAQCLLPLIDTDTNAAIGSAQELLETYNEVFNHCWHSGMAKKIGLEDTQEGDELLIQDLLQLMEANRVDFTLAFRHLTDCIKEGRIEPAGKNTLMDLFGDGADDLGAWLNLWQRRLPAKRLFHAAATMEKVNPVYIPRNHLVEGAIAAAIEEANLEPFHELNTVLRTPFRRQANRGFYEAAPTADDSHYQTFCGT